MASVNNDQTKRKKDVKNKITACPKNQKEQSELTLRLLKSEKRDEIEKLADNYEKNLRKKFKQRDWKSFLSNIKSFFAFSFIETGVGICWRNSPLIVVMALFFMIAILYILCEISAVLIARKKNEMQEEEIRYCIDEEKNKQSDSMICDVDNEFIKNQKRKNKKIQCHRLKALIKIRITSQRCIPAVFILGIIVCVILFGMKEKNETEQDNVGSQNVEISSDEMQNEKEQMDTNTTVPSSLDENVVEQTVEQKEIDETGDTVKNLWNKYMGELETSEIANMNDALSVARENCICWGETTDDEPIWLYTDMEMYSFDAFKNVSKQEENISQRNNVNAKTLYDLGKNYSESVCGFLKSCSESEITDRIIGLACLRGVDIYMSAIRHNLTDHKMKANCYRGAAILLREYADEVYEKQKYKELDSEQVNEWSAKEFMLYIFAAACYEQAQEYGNTSNEENVYKMKMAAKDNWEGFKNYKQ